LALVIIVDFDYFEIDLVVLDRLLWRMIRL